MDLIYAARYTEVCDYSWDDYADKKDVVGLSLPPGIWHVDTSAIPDFFSIIQNRINCRRKYVVVSPSCDFGVCIQKYNHPAMDLEKWVGLQMTPEHGYNHLQMLARINPDRCKESDTYSIKCWSYTEATFDIIPDNVAHWFLANCDIEDNRVTAIPFGIFGNKNKLEAANIIDTYFDAGKLATCGTTTPERNKLLYVNFQFYTTDRYRLYTYFKHFFGDMVTCKQQCPFDEFLNDLATHKFVLCPPGNGPDCYRTLESIYMGAIPILEQRLGCIKPYVAASYPIMVYPNLFMCDPNGLDQIYNKIKNQSTNIDKLLWPYWENRILQWAR